MSLRHKGKHWGKESGPIWQSSKGTLRVFVPVKQSKLQMYVLNKNYSEVHLSMKSSAFTKKQICINEKKD